MAITTLQTSLVKKEKNSNDAWNFYFEKPKSFSYQAGQYIKMTLDIKNPDDRGTTRYFTLSSSPSEDHLMITTHIIKSSFKMRLQEIQIGEKVKIRGPWGDFTLKDNTRPIVFIAGGIGITPYRSILTYVSQNNLDIPIILFVSYKTPDEILYKKQLDEIKKTHKNIKVIITVTQPENTKWAGEVGRIDTKLLQKYLDSFSKYVYYIAGPDPLVESLQKALKDAGVSEDSILTDGFPGYEKDR